MKLKKAEHKVAFAKVGLYGGAASGKTFTSAKIAIGLVQQYKLKKPVAMFDTEPAASFIIPLFEKAGIEFLLMDESRALKDLMGFIDEAEKSCSVAIVDSVTHVWKDAQVSYLAKANQKLKSQGRNEKWGLEFHDWGPIKAEWQRFSDRFLSSKVHMIVCGRAGNVYEYRENAKSGKLELVNLGSKMATEKELAYEPSLLIEMVKKKEENKLVNVALVEKDRADKINGKEFPYPTFKDLQPHFDSLNIGGSHFDSMNQRNSSDLFEGKTEGDGFANEKRQREIWSDEIKGLMIKHDLGGQSAEVKKKKIALFEEHWGTKSWERITNLPSEKIREGYNSLRLQLEGPDQPKETDIPF